MNPTGTYVKCSTTGEEYQAFLPNPLPPNPPIQLTGEVHELMEQANRGLGRLDGVASLLPDTSLFTYFCVRKEAVLSSQIEGTQSSLSDLLLHEHENVAVSLDDVKEVSCYVRALDYGLKRLRHDDFPLSLRLMREIHSILLSSGHGRDKAPGEFRKTQNWIGGSRPRNARFVPPPPDRVVECMGNLEEFIHNIPERTPVLLKAGLAHVQFETIHPFLDGNGRLGRLLIVLLMCAEKALTEPLLYLSLYFKQNRDAYYDHLDRVRTAGDWLGWLRFFFNGIDETSRQAVQTAKAIESQFAADIERINYLGRQTPSVLKVHGLLQRRVVVSVPEAADELGLSAPTVRSALTRLEQMAIVREITGKRRDRSYVYDQYLAILQEGTEPIS